MGVPTPLDPPADLDVVICNYQTPNLLRRCVASWRNKFPPEAVGVRTNLIVVDVEPHIETPLEPDSEVIDGRLGVTVLRLPFNVGYSGACTRAAQLGSAPIMAFFNADTSLINAEAIPRMVRFFDEVETAGIAGPRSIDENGLVTHGGILGTLDMPSMRGFREPMRPELTAVQRAISVSGSAYFIRRSTWNKLRDCYLFREQIDVDNPGAMLRTPHYFEETWLSYHAWAHGEQVWYVGDVEVEHLWDKAPKNGITTSELFAISQPIFRRACDIHQIPHD